MELIYIWLTIAFNYNYSAIQDFLDIYNSKEKILNVSPNNLKDLNLKENIIKKLTSTELKKKAEQIYEKCRKENIQLITIDSNGYPKNLRNIPSKPFILFLKGTLNIQDEFSFAIVGSRNCTDYGRIVTQKISKELASVGIPIVSGMARGIDYYAHMAALENYGRTIAILGCGVNVIYPTENRKLYNNILERGAVISEFIPDTPPLKNHFPIRNRLISGISLGTLIVEATQKSGSMITASFAADQGKDIFAIPGNILSLQSEGTNSLIKDGAKPVTKTEDILEELYVNLTNLKHSSTPTPILSGNENLIFNLINFEPISLESISLRSKLPLNELNSILTILELSGYIKKIAGNNFIRNEKYL